MVRRVQLTVSSEKWVHAFVKACCMSIFVFWGLFDISFAKYLSGGTDLYSYNPYHLLCHDTRGFKSMNYGFNSVSWNTQELGYSLVTSFFLV